MQDDICIECSQKGELVKIETLISLIKKEKRNQIYNQAFYFCKTPNCLTVYFNNQKSIYFHKEDVSIRIGIKEKESPIPMCYCFGWTKEKIIEQIQKQGYTTIIEEISTKIKANKCDCIRKNPSGKCCLKEIKAFLKKIQ